jgi:hypothetical protein
LRVQAAGVGFRVIFATVSLRRASAAFDGSTNTRAISRQDRSREKPFMIKTKAQTETPSLTAEKLTQKDRKKLIERAAEDGLKLIGCEVCKVDLASRLVRVQKQNQPEAWQFRCDDCAERLAVADQLGGVIIDTDKLGTDLPLYELLYYVEG